MKDIWISHKLAIYFAGMAATREEASFSLLRLTRSRRRETMITRSTRFRVAGSTATIVSLRNGQPTNTL